MVLQYNMDAIKAEPNSEDETRPADIDTQQVDAKQDPSEPFTFVEVKCEIEVGLFTEVYHVIKACFYISLTEFMFFQIIN
jgi:hypothetical protein